MTCSNLFNLPNKHAAKETFETILTRSDVRIERIVSNGHSSPEGFWYDQEEDEWVTLLSGEGQIEFFDDGSIITLGRGEHLLIPAHRKHRVARTSREEPTVWLAVFFKPHA